MNNELSDSDTKALRDIVAAQPGVEEGRLTPEARPGQRLRKRANADRN